jgi:hypothetical protein
MIVDDGKLYNPKIKKWIHFLKKIKIILSMWKLTLGYNNHNVFVEHDKKLLNLPLQTLMSWNGHAFFG